MMDTMRNGYTHGYTQSMPLCHPQTTKKPDLMRALLDLCVFLIVVKSLLNILNLLAHLLNKDFQLDC